LLLLCELVAWTRRHEQQQLNLHQVQALKSDDDHAPSHSQAPPPPPPPPPPPWAPAHPQLLTRWAASVSPTHGT